jgi:hypothetical protein
MIIRCHRHNIVLNIHTPTEDKIDNVTDSFYEELERMFDKFPKYHRNILLENIYPKVDREDLLKPTIWTESLHEIVNDNGFTSMNFTIFTVKNIMFPHHNFDKFTCTSFDGKTIKN